MNFPRSIDKKKGRTLAPSPPSVPVPAQTEPKGNLPPEERNVPAVARGFTKPPKEKREK